MEKIVVGSIENYDVIYIPEKDLVFCKNTVLPLKLLKEVYNSSLDRIEVPEKNLTFLLFSNTIEMGCLTTTRENYKSILRNILKLKDERNVFRRNSSSST